MADGDSTPAPEADGDSFSLQEFLRIQDTVGDLHVSQVLETATARQLVTRFVNHVVSPDDDGHADLGTLPTDQGRESIRLGLSSLATFLQANVTGPVLDYPQTTEDIFQEAFLETNQSPTTSSDRQRPLELLRECCQRALDIDGVSAYSYIPYIELFCLAQYIFTSGSILPTASPSPLASHLSWSRLRVRLWHYRLLTQPSLGPGSLFTKSGRWTDVATLEELVEKSLVDAKASVLGTALTVQNAEEHSWPENLRIQFCLEEAQCHILLGNDTKAREALQLATQISKLDYLLSGALGRRTRFQERDISQLVVLAKSHRSVHGTPGVEQPSRGGPNALPLNDDTLLENVEFSGDHDTLNPNSSVPAQLRDVNPENQPELCPEDQIILLAEATIKDTFSPTDSLTLEEILPFAVRVIEDKQVNWQIYTQALLVRSRIELGRSRTVERGVLQLQAVADQVVSDTKVAGRDVQAIPENPIIQARADDFPDNRNRNSNPKSFLPAPKSSESATPQDRLRYVNALASPPRWHLESELAYAWTTVGSLISALEIFKRLRLWPEVALCLASAGASEDEGGRGAGGEEKARAVVRWQLFHRTPDLVSPSDTSGDDSEHFDFDLSALKASEFYGPLRSPPPPNAPRLLCILGDIENDPKHYERAWEMSNRRYARAQRSLGELHLRKQDWTEARQAYKLAIGINRLNSELWSRLGDIELRLGSFPNAAEAYQRAISTADGATGGEDARTWSNLGSALLSWHREILQEGKIRHERLNNDQSDTEDNMSSTKQALKPGKTASNLLRDALLAFKRGAIIADSNWKIWDNVVTLAASLTPEPDLDDLVLGIRSIIRIRKTEEALDTDILALMVREITKASVPISPEDGSKAEQPYELARGSRESKVVSLFENDIVPLITSNSLCWALVSRLRGWRRDWSGALGAAEKGWRAAVGGVGSSLSVSSAVQGQQGNWLTDIEAWDTVVQRTSELVAAYENFGSRIETIGSRWKGKARNAARSVMGRAKESWEGDERYKVLQSIMEDLR